METIRAVIVCAVLIVIGVTIIMMPVLRYICVGWKAKRKDIMDGLSGDARLSYFTMFSKSEHTPADANQAITQFEDLYERWYGRQFFKSPCVLLFSAALVAISLIVFAGLRKLGFLEVNPLFDLPKPAMAAIAGAFLWVVNDFISRSRRLDFSPADVQWGVLRIVIAVPMGYAFAAVVKDDVAPFIAFALGAFPLATLIATLRRVFEKKIDVASQDETSDEIVKLQGINKAIVERLAAEDVTTVTQLAYCDPVRLTMRSNLSFNFVTDCMNQALAWMYFQTDLEKLRPLGLRGAVEIKHLIDDLDNADDIVARDRAGAAFPKIAAKLGQDIETLQVAFREIAQDPFTEFLDEVWV